jgi:hypothetical protein
MEEGLASQGRDQEPTREEIQRMQGPILLEFGTEW